MDPIRRAGVVAFLDWLSRTQPQVRRLSDLSKEEFMHLATHFEASKGLRIDEEHDVYRKWSSTHMWFDHGKSNEDAVKSLPR
jgi:hypothetical protein